MKKSTKILLLLAAAVLLMQLARPELPESAKQSESLKNVPQEVNAILQNACFDCHSNNINLRWYDKITPANFMVADDINKGRSVLNFSNWDTLATPQQNGILYYALNKVLSGEMPLPAYKAVHPSAKLDEHQIAILKDFVLSRTPRKPADSAQIASTNKQYEEWIESKKIKVADKKIAPSPNGIAYIPDYRNWKAISTTDRFDNGTMRIIFANETAVEAIKNHQTNPWPNGAILAKTAWKQQVGKDGIISTGQFVQVEFMIKDAEKYKNTEGWGWARWRGNDLKPYGKVGLEQECISCHKPVKDNDNVFTKPLYLGAIYNSLIKK